ncbi:MAG: PilZ domain-containing protein [Desulfobacteraceae bacterium]
MATTLEQNISPRIKARWPITIITNHRLIEAESKNITANGILARCKESLHENETYRMVITLPQNRYVEVKGKVVWSNLNSIDPNGTFSDMGFSFVKLYGEDRYILNHAISAQLA